jgi:hypothetical protein
MQCLAKLYELQEKKLINLSNQRENRAQFNEFWLLNECSVGYIAGVGNSFGTEGHIRDKLGIRGPVHQLLG